MPLTLNLLTLGSFAASMINDMTCFPVASGQGNRFGLDNGFALVGHLVWTWEKQSGSWLSTHGPPMEQDGTAPNDNGIPPAETCPSRARNPRPMGFILKRPGASKLPEPVVAPKFWWGEIPFRG